MFVLSELIVSICKKEFSFGEIGGWAGLVDLHPDVGVLNFFSKQVILRQLNKSRQKTK